MEKTSKNSSSTWITENKVSLGVAIGVLLALGAGIAAWGFNRGRYPEIPELNVEPADKVSKPLPHNITAPDSNNIPGIASQDSKYINKIKLLRDKVAVESKKGELEMNTIVLIHEALMDITEDNFGKAI